MMKTVTALVCMTALAILAGCAKKEAPQAPAEEVEEFVTAPTEAASTAAQPAAPMDRSKAAAGMMALIESSAQCQQYRDELEAKGRIPGSVDELAQIFDRAFKAGCGKKRQQ
jgi:Fe-S cluster assembly scaffold protein SufB